MGLFALLGGDWGIFQTVGRIKGAIYSSLRMPDQRVRRRAESLLQNTIERHEIDEVQKLFYFVQDHFHFVNDPYDLEFVKSPEVSDAEISKTGQFIGDCDDASAYLAALLKSVGYPVFLTIASPDDENGFDFTHIYVTVYLPALDSYIPLDVTARGKPFGWEVPAKRVESYAL